MEPRIITGIVTKGISSSGKTGEAWTEAYRVMYSSDLINWNKILDSNSVEQVTTKNDIFYFIENCAEFSTPVFRYIQRISTATVHIQYFSTLQSGQDTFEFTRRNGTICQH